MLWVVNALSVAVAVLLLVLGALWAVVGVRGIRGTLPRNRWLGVRSGETMRSEETFRLANRVAGPGTLGAGVILLFGAVATVAVPGGWAVAFGLVALVVALVVIGLVSGIGVRAAMTVPADDDGCSCCSGGEAHDHAAAGEGESSPAADCGTSSCGACSLRGVCAGDTAQA